MKPIRKQRLFIVLFIVFGASIAVGFTLFALKQNINLFFMPKQIVAGEAPKDARIRCAGFVVEGSVKRDSTSLAIAFDLTDKVGTVTVHYTGILPDMFREGQGIMVSGKMDEQGFLQADEVLAKHDEKYMPPEMVDGMKATLEKNTSTP